MATDAPDTALHQRSTDRLIEALAAERVTGTPKSQVYYTIGKRQYIHEATPMPLSDIADAFALLEAHPEWHWRVLRSCPIAVAKFVYRCECWNGRTQPVHTVETDSMCRAITYACIRAVGAGAELDALLADAAPRRP